MKPLRTRIKTNQARVTEVGVFEHSDPIRVLCGNPQCPFEFGRIAIDSGNIRAIDEKKVVVEPDEQGILDVDDQGNIVGTFIFSAVGWTRASDGVWQMSRHAKESLRYPRRTPTRRPARQLLEKSWRLFSAQLPARVRCPRCNAVSEVSAPAGIVCGAPREDLTLEPGQPGPFSHSRAVLN